MSEYAEFEDAYHMVTKLNKILSKPEGFPSIPATRKDCKILTFPGDQRNHQYVICPEQECESFVDHADQTKSNAVSETSVLEFWEFALSKPQPPAIAIMRFWCAKPENSQRIWKHSQISRWASCSIWFGASLLGAEDEDNFFAQTF